MWTGGKRPYGYKIVNKELKIDPNKAPAVRLIFEWYAVTGSSFQVASELNASTYKRPDGVIWVSRHVMKILKNKMYAGEVVYRKTGEIFKAAHDPLIEKELFDRVNGMIGGKEVRVYADHAEIVFTFENAVRSLPLIVKRNYGRLCLHVEGDGSTQDMSVDRTLRQGQNWVDSLLKMHRRAKLGGNPRRSRARRGRKAVRVYKSKKELSRAVNIHSSTISRTTRLCFFSPTIIERIADGMLPDISVNKMIPVTTPFWAEQERALGV